MTSYPQQPLVGFVKNKIASHWFARAFPERCPDGNGVSGTDDNNLRANIQALIPGLEWPLLVDDAFTDEQVLDLTEYAARRVVRPEQGRYHPFYSHYELVFTSKDGPHRLRSEVNEILGRSGTTFELTADGTVQRTGTPAVRQVLTDLQPNTGDARLDTLIIESRTLYLSRKPDQRRLGLERLWDAFERLKTIDFPDGGKKNSATALLAHVNSTPLRDVLETEMRALTDIGNTFTIRHHKTGISHIPDGADDYLYSRMASLITLLLDKSDRLHAAEAAL